MVFYYKIYHTALEWFITCLPPPLGCNFLKGEKCILFLLLSPALSTVLPSAGLSTDLVQVTDSFHLFSPLRRFLASLLPVSASFLLQAFLFGLVSVTLHPLWQYCYWVICSDLLAKHGNAQSSTGGQFLHCSYSLFQVMSSGSTASNTAKANGSNACVPFYVCLFSWAETHNKLPVPELPLDAVFINLRRKLGFNSLWFYSANLIIVQLAHHTCKQFTSKF